MENSNANLDPNVYRLKFLYCSYFMPYAPNVIQI